MTQIHPATESYLGIPGYVYMWIILIAGLSLFAYVIYKRYLLVKSGQDDPRFTSYGKRFFDLVVYGILQKRQPRYFWAGLGHILIFWGFVVLGLRSIDLVTQGLNFAIFQPVMESSFGIFYNALKDIFELIVLFACILAICRRAIGRPKRYEGSHSFEAYLVLGLICFLMITDMVFEGTLLLLVEPHTGWVPAAHLATHVLPCSDPETLETIHLLSYWLHILAFFTMLNLLPLSKHFHIITAIPNVFFRKLKKGSIKPARWGVEDIEDLETLGVEKLEDFTWKDILDFLTCTECGRCSDNCPANASGRPLSPKMITITLRDHAYGKYPVIGTANNGGEKDDDISIAGGIIRDEEIWSCTTCGACEEECPVFISYIDKIIDMRRNLIENARNPKTFNKVLMHLEKTGNPFGKPAKKRSEWVKEAEDISAKILKKGDQVDVLYFVDSYGSYDPRIQEMATAIVKGLTAAEIDFGILGPREKDSGHQVRRLGEEGLFDYLVEENMETFSSISFNRIITTDPHAFNTLKNDYPASFDISHYSQFFLSLVKNGQLKPNAITGNDIYTYHDPCYLGRHNNVYDEPRELLRSIPGLKLVEMEKSRDRSFCCGGGDVILWHEIEEETRMALMRVHMAKEAGANVIVTACPFCLIHFEDAIKTGGLENEMKVMDLMELFMTSIQ